MRIQKYLLAAAVCCMFFGAVSAKASDAPRPNIIVIMVDDMGYSDPGFMGSEIQTPNLDELAAAGTIFTRFLNHAKCEPSRASLMTGVHFHRQTHDHVVRRFKQVTTIAEELRKVGYFTASTGKWHLPDQPTDHGFDHFFGLVKGAANHFDPDGRLGLDAKCYLHKRYALDGKPFSVTDDDFYSTDAYTDYALKFLKERPAASPFFLYLAYTAPHWPLQAPTSNIQKYKDLYSKGWKTLRDERHEGLLKKGMISKDWKKAPADSNVTSWDALSAAQQTDASQCMAVHAAMIDRLDEQLGRILQALKKNGELENTLILFASDNGVSDETKFDRTKKVPAGPAHSFRTLPLGFCNAVNAPYRRYKKSNANGGICSPLIAYWPGKIPAGKIEHRPFSVLDIMPTLLEVAGSEVPDDVRPLDRKSILPLLTGGDYDPSPMCFHLKIGSTVNQKAVVQWPWKVWFDAKEGWSLYNIERDGAETTDLKQKYPEQFQQLIEAYEQFDTVAVKDQKTMNSN